MFFQTCKCCGANLDPGEKCDCKEKEQKYLLIFKTSSTGQMVLDFSEAKGKAV